MIISTNNHTQEEPMAKGKKHRGFKAVQKSISSKEGIPMANAGAILASAARKASPAAKRANPNLLNVKGASKGYPKKSRKLVHHSPAMLQVDHSKIRSEKPC